MRGFGLKTLFTPPFFSTRPALNPARIGLDGRSNMWFTGSNLWFTGSNVAVTPCFYSPEISTDPDLDRGRGGIGRLETTGPEDRKLADLEVRASAGEIFDAAVHQLADQRWHAVSFRITLGLPGNGNPSGAARAGAFARLLLGGPHVPAEGGGKPGREDLRRITRPESGTGSCAGQRRGTWTL